MVRGLPLDRQEDAPTSVHTMGEYAPMNYATRELSSCGHRQDKSYSGFVLVNPDESGKREAILDCTGHMWPQVQGVPATRSHSNQ